MAIKYYCDCCSKEVGPPSKINPRPIATIDMVIPATGKVSSQMCCVDCTQKLKDFINKLQKENNVVSVGEGLNLQIKK